MNKRKISIRLFIITIALLLGILLCIQLPVLAAKGKSTASSVRIRKAPTTESEVIDVLAENDEVEIIAEEGDWYKVSAKGVIGYVSKSLINETDSLNNETDNKNVDNVGNNNSDVNTNADETTETNNQQNNKDNNSETNNQVSNSTTNRTYKMAENANVNILPVITSESIGELKKDEDVTLIINAGLWVYVQSNNLSGWIRIDKLSTENINAEQPNNEENSQTNSEEQPENREENNQNNVEENEQNKEESKEENNNNEGNNQETSQAEQNSQTNMYSSPKTMYVKSSAVNVRSQSNTTSDVVDSLGLNAEVKVVGEENGWYKVEVNGRSGYIRNDLVANEKTEVTSRTNAIDRTAKANTAKAEETKAQETQTTKAANNTQSKTTENKATNSVPVSSSGVTGSDIAAYAQQFVGCRYVYGAAGPSSFDCSGLTMYVYKHFGYSLSHSSRVQATQGKAVTGSLQPGDILVFSNDGKTVGHVGIYIGNDKFVHAADSSTGVVIGKLSDRWNKSKYWGARRIL